MFLLELITAFLIAAVLATLLTTAFGWEHPRRSGLGPALLFLTLVLFMATWAGGIWMTPFGPDMFGVYWLPFVIIGIFVALIILATVPPRRPQTVEQARKQAGVQEGAQRVLGASFWLIIVVLVAAIITHYAT